LELKFAKEFETWSDAAAYEGLIKSKKRRKFIEVLI